MTDFKDARCRQYEEATCGRGGYCNFMHLKKVSSKLQRRLLANSPRDDDRRDDRRDDRGPQLRVVRSYRLSSHQAFFTNFAKFHTFFCFLSQ